MPRTKQVKNYAHGKSSDKTTFLKLTQEKEDAMLRDLNSEDMKLATLEAENDTIVAIMKQSLIKYKDVRLKDLNSFDVTHSLSVINSLSTNKARKEQGRSRIKRSISDTTINKTEIVDIGLLQVVSKSSTVSSDSGHSSGSNMSASTSRSVQRSRNSNTTTVKDSAQKNTAKTRRSRSLSRNGKSGFPLDFGAARSTMRTPLGQRTAIMAPITPKMKDCNSLPALMRRPKQNEIALSMQGSPLMVNAIMTDSINANIPLSDGRVIALQPEYMRLSDIGDISLEPESISDLQQLRDNLTKLCESLKLQNAKSNKK